MAISLRLGEGFFLIFLQKTSEVKGEIKNLQTSKGNAFLFVKLLFAGPHKKSHGIINQKISNITSEILYNKYL